MVVGGSVWSLRGIGMGEWAFLNLPKVQKQGVASAVVSFGDSALMLDHCLTGKKLTRVFWRDQNLTQPWAMHTLGFNIYIQSCFLCNLGNGYNYSDS